MQRYIQTFSLITLGMIGAGSGFLIYGYGASSAEVAAIGSLLIIGSLATLLISVSLAMVTARQNAQHGWFAALLAILIVGGLAPYGMFLVFASIANGDRVSLATHFGLAYLLIYTLAPLSVPLSSLIYSFKANRFKIAWDRPSVAR
jgi:hypothetical protein